MRKLLFVLVGFMTLFLLTACWRNVDNGNNSWIVDDNQQKEDTLEDLVEKTPLTLEDLNRINKNKFPTSYTYTVYDVDTIIETWEYVYPEDANHNILLPIEETMVNREIVSSLMSHDRINTVVDIKLKNGESYSVLYIINPDTLEYIGASLSTPKNTTLYTFVY